MTMPAAQIVSFVDDGLGHSSYLVDLGDGVGLVIDPPRFPEPHREAARARGLRIAFTADTHSHADYVSGSPELAARGARFLASRGANLEVPHQGVRPGDQVDLGQGWSLRAIATPGHTPDHLAFLLVHDNTPRALFSGGALMVGTVGRTDLLGAELAEPLARRLYRALRDEILTLPDGLAVYPTHGAGSFCSAPGAAERTTTIGRERATNALLRTDDEDTFVEQLLAGFGTFPSYFTRLPEVNRRGPRLYEQLPSLAPLGIDQVRVLVDDGVQLIDARPIAAFAAGHLPGSLSIALRPVFGSWLGWLADPDRPLVFVLDADQDRVELVRRCLDVGYEELGGELAGGVTAWRGAGLPLEQTALIEARRLVEGDGTVIDVRQRAEFEAGHVPGARNVELGALAAADVSAGPLAVMCGHGERAMTGASILQRAGREDVTAVAGGPDGWATAPGRRLATG